ncbi:MAG: DUF86 domain-containing protein [Richelia sp. SM2_1_7]|nr:DUF86 domain-containing protein [Richelia sp. SM2_1_7]
MAESGKFRNRLVHIYEEIDPQEVYKTIFKVLEDFPIYQRLILTYLDSVEARNG